MDYLLISISDAVTADRLRNRLSTAGVPCARTSLGLRAECGQEQWPALLQSIAQMLTPAGRADTRVAMLRDHDDPEAVHRAIFRAQTLETLQQRLADQWFDEVMERDGLVMHFQPLVQYPPGRIHGYECLMRGLDAGGKIIPPDRMFAAAAKMGKTALLDQRCRSAAIRDLAVLAQPQEGRESHEGNDKLPSFRASVPSCLRASVPSTLTFFINFVPSTIENPRRCLAEMLEQLNAGGLKANQICFEVVETDRNTNRRELQSLLVLFRKAGFKVALDDVGAGYASLLSLSYLRPDYIKLDRELVQRAAHSALEAKMVADLAETARQNGIITIAEGIETEIELRLAMRSGIRITQGYFHARPGPLALDEAQTRAVMERAGAAVATMAA